MGILSSVIGRIGIPIALIAATGLLLFSFREQIGGAIRGGAQVVGGAISQPFTGFFQGLEKGFEGIPEQIKIPFPGFEFAFGTGKVTTPNLDPPKQGEQEFMGGTLTTPAGCVRLEDGRVSCPSPPTFERKADAPRTPAFIPEAEASELTLIQGGSILVGTNTGRGTLTRKTREQILAENPNAVGLFDLLSTERTEFLPLGTAAVEFFQKEGQGLRLSGQIFKEIKNVGDVV